MKPALVVLVRAYDKQRVEYELTALPRELSKKAVRNTYDRVYIVAVEHSEKSGKNLKQRLEKCLRDQLAGVLSPQKLTVYLPKELKDVPENHEPWISEYGHDVRSDAGRLAPPILIEYLRGTLFENIVMPAGHQRMDFLWRSGWRWGMASVSALVACTDDIGWCRPAGTASGDLWPEFPPDFRYRDLFRPEPSKDSLKRITGSSKAIKQLKRKLSTAAQLSVPVLLVGETGTGKELCALAIHELSGRTGPFLPVNAAMLDPNRAESVLFGHIEGAFTGARTRRDGRIVEAKNGTFFLDEALDLPRTVQAQFLRAIQHAERSEIEVIPMGASGTSSTRVNTRLVCAVQEDPLAQDRIRADLYHRISWIRIDIPPLREREKDAQLIGKMEMARLSKRVPNAPTKLTRDALHAITDLSFYHWPGNVRELRKVIFGAWFQALLDKKQEVSRADLMAVIPERSALPTNTGNLRVDVANLVVQRIDHALKRSPNNKTAAARSLGFSTGQSMERYCSQHASQLARFGDGET